MPSHQDEIGLVPRPRDNEYCNMEEDISDLLSFINRPSSVKDESCASITSNNSLKSDVSFSDFSMSFDELLKSRKDSETNSSYDFFSKPCLDIQSYKTKKEPIQENFYSSSSPDSDDSLLTEGGRFSNSTNDIFANSKACHGKEDDFIASLNCFENSCNGDDVSDLFKSMILSKNEASLSINKNGFYDTNTAVNACELFQNMSYLDSTHSHQNVNFSVPSKITHSDFTSTEQFNTDTSAIDFLNSLIEDTVNGSPKNVPVQNEISDEDSVTISCILNDSNRLQATDREMTTTPDSDRKSPDIDLSKCLKSNTRPYSPLTQNFNYDMLDSPHKENSFDSPQHSPFFITPSSSTPQDTVSSKIPKHKQSLFSFCLSCRTKQNHSAIKKVKEIKKHLFHEVFFNRPVPPNDSSLNARTLFCTESPTIYSSDCKTKPLGLFKFELMTVEDKDLSCR